MIKQATIVLPVLLSVVLWYPTVACADHPVEVQRLYAEGDYFRALEVYERLPDRRLDKDTHVAAAKSAWALGLIKRAAELFDSVLRADGLENDERSRLTLSRGIIEYQEGRYQEAALFAEKSASYLPEKAPLRGRALLLWGQSLLKAQEYSTAEEKLWRALAEVAPSDRPDVAMSLGTAQLKLGKLADAERTLKAITIDHPNAPDAVRLLATISMQTENDDRAQFWLGKGKADYSNAFVDSWADYGQLNLALRGADLVRARTIVEQAEKRLPPSDAWLIIMQASLEQAEWRDRKETRKD
jgi:tetratricopeptide (TPR) repeat protein